MAQTILIDSDIIVYKIAFSVETPIYVVKGGVYKTLGKARKYAKIKEAEVFKRNNVGSEGELRLNLKNLVNTMVEDISSFKLVHHLTETDVSKNYRHSIATFLPYKGNRMNTSKPFYYKKLRNILFKEYSAELVSGQETDDILAIKQIEAFKKTGDYESTIIASIDKDLDSVPGWHYHLKKRLIYFIDEKSSLINFFRQLLVGDVTDNIPGLTRLLGILGREEEAKKLSYSHYIKKFEEETKEMDYRDVYKYVFNMYKKYGLGVKEISEIGNLLWLKRHNDELWSNSYIDKDGELTIEVQNSEEDII